MVANGEVDALVAERVWQEVAKGLMEAQPSRMLAVLQDCGALARILPELTINDRLLQVIDRAAADGLELCVRFAVLMLAVPVEQINALSERLRVPNDCRELAVMAAREQSVINNALALSGRRAGALVRALRRPAQAAAFCADAAMRSNAMPACVRTGIFPSPPGCKRCWRPCAASMRVRWR